MDISKYKVDTTYTCMEEIDILTPPDTVKGRVLQLDADIICYECADDNSTVSSCVDTLLNSIESKRVYAGAEKVICHLTGALKGNRFNISTVKPYQGNRTGKSKPIHLKELREFLQGYSSNTVQTFFNEEEEADDSMTQFHYNNLNSVICSKDKDLRVNAGLHLDWTTLELRVVDSFGFLEVQRTHKGTKKVYGEGTLWFWFQMIAGDRADNIVGLPKIKGSKGFVNCGDIRAYEAIMTYEPSSNNSISDTTLYWFVLKLYEMYYEDEGYNMFIEQAKLLWMRRHKGENDVINFFESIKDVKCES